MNELNLAFAFTAGLFATINPCGWAMLPSFVSYYLGSREDDYGEKPFVNRLWEGIVLGLLVTAGFLTIFGTAGVILSAGLRFVIQWMPLAALLVGVVLVLLGLWLFSGKSLPFSIPTPDLNLNARNPRSVFLFGVAYAVASLSCTLPIFLAVIGAGLTAAGPVASAVMLLTYGAGMAVVLMSVSLSAALFKDAITQWFRKLLPFMHKFGAAMLVIAGIYLIWFQGRYIPLILAGL